MKIADVKLTWKPSVSTDVREQTVIVTIDGVEKLNSTVSPSIQEVLIEVNAESSVLFTVTTVDNEGNSTVSEAYTFTLGDLDAPQPATFLAHEVVAVRDATV